MTPTKLLIGQILIVFAIVIAGVWASTQWAAAMLAYQPELGLPWFVLRHWPVYYPWALFDWWYHFDAYAPHVFAKAGMLAGTSGFLGFLTAVFGSLWRAGSPIRSPPMARRAGQVAAISGRQACSATTASCWARWARISPP
jgi:type IV secretion system protein VirD4